MKIFYILTLSLFFSFNKAYSFCGFYVAKGDSSLFNKASQVVLVRNENKTVISMLNDYEGPFKEFALVVPVPSVLKKEQVNVGQKKLFDRIDAFTAPRLVEYFDKDPCAPQVVYSRGLTRRRVKMAKKSAKAGKSLGVTVEEKFTVGEYDIVILSAKESQGLETWLTTNKYKIPKGAHRALAPYIAQNMKFFVAKVNLGQQAKTGLNHLRPIQFAFESEKFMLPIRLGMLNAKGYQDLFVYVLSKNGRVETKNYRTIKIPTDIDIPVYVKNKFSDFYKALFETQVKKERMKAVFTEYFWDMGWCDPCAANPLTPKELRQLGVFWIQKNTNRPDFSKPRPPIRRRGGQAQPVKVTRLHLRYDHKTFPEDLMFHETNDKTNFQGRYILRHPWKGNSQCTDAQRYFETLSHRQEKEAQNLAQLTGWNINEIRKNIDMIAPPKKSKNPWWKDLWE